MIRIPSLALALLALSACATTTNTGSSSVAESQRNTTMITTVTASGQTTTVPVTTYSGGGAAPTRIEASADSVFAILGEVFTSLGISVETVDSRSFTVGNSQVRVTRRLGSRSLSEYLDCGVSGMGVPIANTSPIRLSVLSSVTPDNSGSVLRTVVQGVYVTAESSGTTPCTTKGTLEALIARTANLRVATR